MRIRVVFIVVLLVFNSILATGLIFEPQPKTLTVSYSFSTPTIIDDGSYLDVLIDGASACLYQPGQPVLPMSTKTIELPFGSILRDVTISPVDEETLQIQKKIMSAPYPVNQMTLSTQPKESAYQQTCECYPTSWFTSTTGGGLNNDGQHVMFVTLRVFPVRYNEADDILLYLHSCNITLHYELPEQSPFPTQVINDLVIICPLQFLVPLKRLASHKNTLGVRTQIKTVNEIYQEYPGYDRPEQIKYFIKDAVETWGTTYVLLVGGLKSHFIGKPRDNINTGTRDWYLPVRYSNLWDDDALYDPGFISDLYYADIYDGEGSFCTWNSFDDEVYGGWSHLKLKNPPDYPNDQIDFYPDVYLGRLPCRNLFEVTVIVNKIISYEQKPADSSWFNRMVVVGGDPYDDPETEFLEGELIGEKALSYMSGFEQCRLFSSNKQTNPDFTPVTNNILREINEGCGFLFFDGHGGPSWWNTFWPGEFESLIMNGGISVLQFPFLRNFGKLPVCIVGGCHNNQFNVSLVSTLTDPWNTHFMWSQGAPIRECWGWSLLLQPRRGAIATLGNTGLGYEAGGEVGDLDGDGVNEPDCVESLCGYLETQFFKGYNLNHIDILGKAWGYAIAEYLRIYPGMEQWMDAKTLEQWVLFGDPSLKIGGYKT